MLSESGLRELRIINYELGITNWGNCLNLDFWDGLDGLDFDQPRIVFILKSR